MKDILILAAISFLFTGCGNFKDVPPFPSDITKHYAVDVASIPLPKLLIDAVENKDKLPPRATDSQVNCLEFDIVSKHPYKIKFVKVADLKDCSGVGGYKPDDMVKFLNWVDDILALGAAYKLCPK